MKAKIIREVEINDCYFRVYSIDSERESLVASVSFKENQPSNSVYHEHKCLKEAMAIALKIEGNITSKKTTVYETPEN